MAFIGLGEVNRNLIAIIVWCIFCCLNRILNLFSESELFKNKVLTNIFIAFADVFTVIPYIISKKRSKKKFLSMVLMILIYPKKFQNSNIYKKKFMI